MSHNDKLSLRSSFIIYSRPPPPPPPIPPISGLTKKRRYWESYITYKTLIWDLEIGGGIGGGEAVFGGAVLGGRLYIHLYIVCSMLYFIAKEMSQPYEWLLVMFYCYYVKVKYGVNMV